MDLFKSQFDRIQKQLSALTPSQKMLTAAMVAIMVMTLVWWGRYAGEPEMEALLPQSISADDLPNIEAALDAKGIKHVMSGDKLLVPADRKLEAVANLMYNHALPHNAQDGFDEVLKNINPFMSQTQTDKMWNRGKEMTVAQIITHFPDVAEANVMIDPTRERAFGGGVEPSATVTITTRSGSNIPKHLVDAAADAVQGALSSLPRKNIKVVINGAPSHVRIADDLNGGMDGSEQIEKTQAAEALWVDHVEKAVCIANAMVTVTVNVDNTHQIEHIKKYDKDGVIQKESEIETKTTETVGSASGGADAGVGANTQLSVAASAPAAAGPTSTTESNVTKMHIAVPETTVERTTPAGGFKPIAACVRVPLSLLFAAIYTHDNPSVKEPTEVQMAKMIDAQLKKTREAVQTTTGLAPEFVSVDTYLDPAPIASIPMTASAGMSMALLTGGHIRDAVLGVLALVSLFMVSMMVKKGTPAPLAIAAPVPAGPATVIEVGGELAGEVGTGNTNARRHGNG